MTSELETWIADALNEDMGDVAGAMAEEIVALRRKCDAYDRAVTKLVDENTELFRTKQALSKFVLATGVSEAVLDRVIDEARQSPS